jgi:hypothetical protein
MTIRERVGTCSQDCLPPSPGDKVSVPAQQGGRLDDEAPETLVEEQSRQPSQHRSVSGLQYRSVDLASEHRHFMSQHDDFDGEILVPTKDEPDQLKEAAEHPV